MSPRDDSSQLRQAARRWRRHAPNVPNDRVVGGLLNIVTRVVGLRPEFIPQHFRRQLNTVGVSDETLARVLGNLRSLSDWPYAWEAEGDRCYARGQLEQATIAYYIAQRVLISDSPLKQRLYATAAACYDQIPHSPPLERLRVVRDNGQAIAALLQAPTWASAQRQVPLVVLVPGITATKEEAHPLSQAMIDRGIAVCRIDNPRYGETDGVVDVDSRLNPAVVFEHLRADERFDKERMHLMGMSMGAYWTLHSAAAVDAASVMTISSPYDPEQYADSFSHMSLRAMKYITGLESEAELRELYEQIRLSDVAAEITCPVKLYHGGRDNTIPAYEMYHIADAVSGPTSTTYYEHEHHICVGELYTIVGDMLDWIADPDAYLQRERAAQLRKVFDDAAATTDAAQEPGLASPKARPA